MSGAGAARTISAALGLFLISSLSLSTGCGVFGQTYSLTALSIEPGLNETCVYPGAQVQYHAYGTYTEGGHTTHTHDLTDSVSWSVTYPQFATISSTGLATAGTVAIGISNILATTQGEFGILHATSNLQIENPCSGATVRLIHVIPAAFTLKSIGDTENPLAIAIAPSALNATDVTRQVTWQSADPAIATVDANGRIAAVGAGKTTITATQKLPDGTLVSGTQNVEVSGGSQQQ